MNTKNLPEPIAHGSAFAVKKDGTKVKMILSSFSVPIVQTGGGKEMYAWMRIENADTGITITDLYFQAPFSNKKTMEIMHEFNIQPEKFIPEKEEEL